MKYSFILLLILFFSLRNGKAQKPLIDSSSFGKWPEIRDVEISNDGHYSVYTVINKRSNSVVLHVVSNTAGKSMDIEGGSLPRITGDSRAVLFLKGRDSLGILALSDKRIEYVPGVLSFKVASGGEGGWYAYLGKGEGKERWLAIGKGDKGAIRKRDQVAAYFFDQEGETLLVVGTEGQGSEQQLRREELASGNSRVIWNGIGFGEYGYDDKGRQLAFIARDGGVAGGANGLYYYKEGMEKAMPVVSGDSLLFGAKFGVANRPVLFSKDGNKVLFELQQREEGRDTLRVGYKGVNVWNYKDAMLISKQLSAYFAGARTSKYWAVVNVRTGRLVRVNEGGEEVKTRYGFNDFVLTEATFPHDYQPGEFRLTIYKVSVEDGSRRVLLEKNKINRPHYLSPDQQFVVCFDPDSLNYMSYETATGIRRRITNAQMPALYEEQDGWSGNKYMPYGIAGWSMERHSMFVYDEYDIWEVWLDGSRPPQNITNHYGRKHGVVFSVMDLNDREHYGQLYPSKGLLLTGFDPETKNNGFWHLGSNGRNPVLGNMEGYTYLIDRTGEMGNDDRPGGFTPVKARDAERYIVERQSAQEFPNVYVTDDFKTFKAISDEHPERSCNWLRSELVTWPMKDGQMSQGILYKPEDFDPKKRYPVIFYYYQKMSNDLNDYLKPDYCQGIINIPYYVSNGYLVFRPDIHYRGGHNGAGVVNAVESAARYLSHFPWVDSTKMGLQGHSFGGWETNYLVTHSKLFAAACSASGFSDEISAYDEIKGTGDIQQYYFETGFQASPFGIGVTPWTHPELYIENSPIFSVDKVVMPVLISIGTKDKAVPFVQAVEMYLALKRAGKKVWMLEYENGDHILFGEDAKDFTIRMKQFFDHYLKGSLAPKWMTEGVPATLKGIDGGLELDSSGKEP